AGLRAEIGERDGANMSPLGVAALPPELETIALSVNRLLERLRAALESERDFTSNSAHELRTPIAGALAQTQRLIVELPPGALVERARKIETALSDLARLAEKLLQLARAEAGIGAAAGEVDLVEIAGMVMADFGRGSSADDRLHFENRVGGQLLRSIDPDAFAIALRNLIENALIHGDDREAVVVAITAVGDFEVTNGGRPVPADRMADLAKRFRRGATDAPGSGLGLAIAEKLVAQMGGRLELLSPAPGRGDGFQARMRLPKDSLQT
ncbi:MAG: HAMP domain-containing sensor histidine kinase, partial [Mesorhizobium sp.]|nr:HAMP domain-containing sensor histidine kinase [Mesorhizobium sp.]